MHGHPRLIRLAAILLAVCCAVSAVTGCDAAPRESQRPRNPVVVQRPPVVMVVGDSFTVGSGPVRRWHTYASVTARELGWQVILAGAAGTGFVNRGRVNRDFATSFAEELAWRPAPDLLIISGGHNDRRVSPARVHVAAGRLLATVRQKWPRTRIVVVGPIWISRVPGWALDVRDAVAAAAKKAKVTFLDPLPQRRYLGRRSTILLPDGVHPTAVGHTRLARWLVEALRKSSLTG
ncbi:SGNH/GDSL hydrolase family protein [Streptosporangium sp. KLBMP 9127]|nr:SGNH/GDSL hydrolase family protein [Streptosporangium sp. KLBMP 9127]